MDLKTSSTEDVLRTQNFRKAPTNQGHFSVKEVEPLLPPTIINIPKHPRALLVEKEKEENIQKWTVTSCDSLIDALQFFDASSLRKELNESINILLLRIEVDEDFVDLNSREISDLAKKCVKKTILILLISKDARKFSIFWKLKDVESLLTLKSYKEKLSDEQMDLFEFVGAFLINSLKVGHQGLHATYSNRNESSKIELHFLADQRGYNLLLLAVESGNATIAKLLLESGFSPDLPDSYVSAQSIALAAGQFNVLLMLLRSNLTYPSNFDITKCPVDVQQFVELSKSLRKALKDKNVDKVEEILRNNKDMRHFYTTSNESACKFAIENHLIDMYEILLTKKVLFGPHEDVIEIMNKLDYEEKRHLREVHFNNSIDMPEKHINTLMANSYVGHEEVSNVQDKLDCVQNAFKLLNENPFIKIILLIVAASKKFRIIFDFNRDSVELIDPTAESYTAGMFYLSGRMYIGAKQLLDKTKQNEAIATIAHEFCHYAMNLVYNNDANPYKKDDKESQDKVEEVSNECQAKSGTEDIVDMVYECYPQDMHHAELIVRAPHMMAYYHDQPEKLEESKENFHGLFKLYEEKVYPEMEKALPEIEARVEKEMTMKEEEIFKLKKRFYFAIIFFISLLIGVGTFAYISVTTSYEYSKLSPKNKAMIEDHPIIYAGTKVQFKDIFKSNSSAYHKLQPSEIKFLLENTEPLNIDTTGYSHLRTLVSYNWTTLVKPLQDKFLNAIAIYQSENSTFKNLYQNYSESFTSLTQVEIEQGLFNSSLVVGNMINSDVKFYIERKLIDENINLVYHKFITEQFNETFEEFYKSFVKQGFKKYNDDLNEIEESASYISNPKSPANLNEFEFATFDFNQITEKAKTERFIILSDEAGTGKTVTFQILTKHIKSINPLYWVSYIDLNSFTRKFQEYDQPIDLLRYYLANTDFEKLLFDMAYKSNQMFLLWNGFDEISSGFYKEILNVLKYIYQNSKIIQLLCTRPTYSRELRNALEKNSFRLVPFGDSEKIEFVTKYIQSLNNSKNIDEKVSQTIAQIHALEKKSSANDFSTPLILLMVADIDSGQDVAESANLYSIYNTFIRKKIDIWKTRRKSTDQFITKILSDSINLMDVFQYYAVHSQIYDYNTADLLKMPFLEIFNQNFLQKIKSYSEIAETGILHDDGYGNLKLSHKSFIEFLMAQYFISNLYSSNVCTEASEAELRVTLFFYFARIYGQSQWLVTEFMKDFLLLENIGSQGPNMTAILSELGNRKRDQKSSLTKKTRKNNNNDFNFQIFDVIDSKHSNSLVDLLGTNQPQIFDFLIDFFKKDPRVLKSLLRLNEPETLYTASFNPIYNAYHINPKRIMELVKKTNVLSENELKNFANGKNQKGTILLGMHHYRSEKNNRIHEDTKGPVIPDNATICDLLEKLDLNLTTQELKYFLTSQASLVIINDYLYQTEADDMQKSTSSFRDSNANCNASNLFWALVEDLDDREKQTFLKHALVHYLEVSSSPSYPPNKLQLTFILNQFQRLLKPQEISDIFVDNNIFHKAALRIENFKILWEFYMNDIFEEDVVVETTTQEIYELPTTTEIYEEDIFDTTTIGETEYKITTTKVPKTTIRYSNTVDKFKDRLNYLLRGPRDVDLDRFVKTPQSNTNYIERNRIDKITKRSANKIKMNKNTIKSILTKTDNGLYLYDNFNLTAIPRYNTIQYNTRYYDNSEISILYRGITNANNKISFNYFTGIYKDNLNNVQLKDVLTHSFSSIHYFTSFAKQEICEEYATLLKETFENDMEKLKEFLNLEQKDYTFSSILDEFSKKRLQCAKKINDILIVKEKKQAVQEDKTKIEKESGGGGRGSRFGLSSSHVRYVLAGAF